MPVILLLAACCAATLGLLAARSLTRPKRESAIDKLVEEGRKTAKKHQEG